MKLTIKFYSGNLVSGCDQTTIDSIDFPATITAYCQEISAALPEYEIEFDEQPGEGPTERFFLDGMIVDDYSNRDDIEHVIDVITRVFEQGAFWSSN